MISKILRSISLLFIGGTCSLYAGESTAYVPVWAQEAIWYQIFVERFHNGDPGNDPTLADMQKWDSRIPDDWTVSRWNGDWYAEDPWMQNPDTDQWTFEQKLQWRRYGGDLQGVLEKVDYLDSLGITAVYFNPLNDAPSLHKYDARNWRHIDVNFGPDPEGDKAIMASENPADPATWRWTAADRLFLEVVQALHGRGIRVVLDYSFNHTGTQFWAFEDVLEHQQESDYKDWYQVEHWDVASSIQNEFQYRGWAGLASLPEVNREVNNRLEAFPHQDNLAPESLREHIFAVARRWLDPNGDGDPSDGIDGYRLDVAAEVPIGFWTDFRQVVREVNPEAYLLGEIWWKSWPYELEEPQPYLGEVAFDGIMNYRWYRNARRKLGKDPGQLNQVAYAQSWAGLIRGIAPEHQRAMMNLLASHDAPRALTSLYNPTLYKYRTKPYEDSTYKVHRPPSFARERLRAMLVHQFTWVGAPHIWNGDEMGMWGGDDPDCRKPLWWSEFSFDNEAAHPYATLPQVPASYNEVAADTSLWHFYQQAIAFRKAHPCLIYGDVSWEIYDDAPGLLAYRREDNSETLMIVINSIFATAYFDLPMLTGNARWELLWSKNISKWPSDSSLKIDEIGFGVWRLVE